MKGNIERALKSLVGLWVGDAYGEQFFARPIPECESVIPAGTWKYTDDTCMALSIVEELMTSGEIRQQSLAQRFAERYSKEPARGYGAGVRTLLEKYRDNLDCNYEARNLFGGGSYGNGAAMRVAPLGAFYCDDIESLIREAEKSAAVTHAHAEGRAGAIAIALATGFVSANPAISGQEMLRKIVSHMELSKVRQQIEYAMDIPAQDLERAAMDLGTGRKVTAQDTVPFCLWIVANYRESYESALWNTLRGGGDLDTTCAIVGGIVSCRHKVPERWIASCERLPAEIMKYIEKITLN
ncbi:MAG: ADP-ribosylglycohydrolase family protein [Candidatus Riflebacteria bacterium]|nr:ADP-ribosylglycohydrolase family protein [Candidatus Riflebacteria bacterium]